MAPTKAVHVVTLVQRRQAKVVQFAGLCSCGERSEWFGAAGLVSGWDAKHTGKGGA